MMGCFLTEKMGIPKSCLLGSTIFKKQFVETGNLSSSDKKLLSNMVQKIIWQACLKPETINIQPYRDEVREYNEIEIIEVILNEPKKEKRIAEIIMRNIPYPILLQITCEDQIMLAAGHSRINLGDKSRNTIEEFLFIEWIDTSKPLKFQQQFFDNVHISSLSFSNLFRFYDKFVNQLILLQATKWAEKYLEEKLCFKARKITSRLENLTTEKKHLLSLLEKETQFNRKIDLNIAIKECENEINSMIEEAKHSEY